ncbi:MAG TPA: twin-arginine translocase subunit TatC [Gemmatimonadaceae bacterium]|nr:twin-arginine translocase subunit TatC [Gemmatimonadaceae bacterium]
MPLDQPNDAGEMPFLDHLEELRWRIVKALVAVIIGFFVSMTVCTNYDVIALMVKPIVPYLHGKNLIVTHPVEKFTILLKVATGFAIVLASPAVAYQVWAFLSPALTARERKVIVPVLIFAAVLFLSGVAMSVFVFVPVTMGLMDNIKTVAIEPFYSAGEYFGFLFSVSLAFGVMFELPILILALTALGLVTPGFLAKYRRHAFVVLLVACEIITPGDFIISTLMLFVPVYGLYELSIIASWVVHRTRMKRKAEAEAIGAGAAA